MAQKVAAATGAWSAAATWNSVTNTPTLHASTNVVIDTTARFTAAFTAPNTTNACTGVLLFINAIGSGGTVTVTLQESTVDTAATRTINITSLVALTWVYFTFATPYVFTTTGAGAYRFKVQAASPTGTTNAAADSGASLYAYLATDDRTGVPGTTDDIWVCGQNQATAITVTMDGTQTIGSKTDTVLAVQRTLGNAISINNLGVIAWDTAASATLTCGGNIICNNGSGELQMGTVAVPMPAARLARLRFDMAATGNHGLRVFSTGKLTLQGTPKSSTTLWKAKLVSGVGTAASPLVVDAAVDWSVGDEIAISATSNNATNYNETEYRFIITKNSATSYVLSATSGGVEAAFTFTHTTDAWVLNISRNVIIDSTNAARSFYVNCASTVQGNVDIDWTLFDIVGTGTTDKNGVELLNTTSTWVSCDYSVVSQYHAGWRMQLSRSQITFTGLIAVKQIGTSSGVAMANTPYNKAFIDCFVLGAKRVGFTFVGFNIAATRCYAIACNIDNDAGASGIGLSTGGSMVLSSCEAHCNRTRGIVLSGISDVTLNNYLSGTKGTNTLDVNISSTGVYNTVVFINSSFGSATLIANYLTMLAGSEIAFHAYNGNSNNHIWYTETGAARSTGAGLVDTTVKTAGSLGIRLAPEDLTTGFTWEFLIGIKASSAASIFGFAQKNVAFGTAVCTIELFLPGSTVADATATLDNTTGSWQVFNLAANYTGLVAAFATIRITAKTATASADVYFDDFYNGTNVLTALDAWYNGKPTPVMTDLLGDPAAVWTQLTSTFTTVGTVGYQLTNGLVTIQADTDDLQTRIPAALTVGGNIKADTLMIEGVDATNQIRDSILTDATRFAGANVDAAVSSRASQASLDTLDDYVDTEITDIQSRLPATLDGANMRSSVKAMDTGIITSSVIATDAIGAAELAADAVSEIQSGLSTLTAAQVWASATRTLTASLDPTSAAIVTALLATTIEGRAFEEIIKDIWAQVVGDFVANDDDDPTSIVYEGPNGATQLTHTITDTTRSWS